MTLKVPPMFPCGNRTVKGTDRKDWTHIWSMLASCSMNILTFQSAFKTISLWHMVPSHLTHLYSFSSDACFWGSFFPGDVLHTWWMCPMLSKFWTKVLKLLNHYWQVPLACPSTLKTPRSHKISIKNRQLVFYWWLNKLKQELGNLCHCIDIFFINKRLLASSPIRIRDS